MERHPISQLEPPSCCIHLFPALRQLAGDLEIPVARYQPFIDVGKEVIGEAFIVAVWIQAGGITLRRNA